MGKINVKIIIDKQTNKFVEVTIDKNAKLRDLLSEASKSENMKGISHFKLVLPDGSLAGPESLDEKLNELDFENKSQSWISPYTLDSNKKDDDEDKWKDWIDIKSINVLQNEKDTIIDYIGKNKNTITRSNNQINHKKLKITFIILVAVLIISVAGFFINIFYIELAVFHFLNVLLIALFVLSMSCIVMLSIVAKNINTSQENLCLRSLFNRLVLSKPEQIKSIDQNLNINSQMQNQYK